MRTDNKDSEKDLNANPESRLNTNRPVSRPADTFPESLQARDEMEKVERTDRMEHRENKKDDDIELLAQDVTGTVGARDTSSSPEDIAGVADLDRGMRRASRRNR
ncbi:MAG TPA: hypothetical protein VFT90_10490 [Chryseosolibacter sp.]|nr:hypothetical protein [Chryseosolibacter sp.]